MTMDTENHTLPRAIGKPATRALLAAGITALEQVIDKSDEELLALHGVGPKAIRILREEIGKRTDSVGS